LICSVDDLIKNLCLCAAKNWYLIFQTPVSSRFAKHGKKLYTNQITYGGICITLFLENKNLHQVCPIFAASGG